MKLGKYITMMPYSVISGFMSGIGCILIVMQLAPALGSAAPAGGVIGTLTALPDIIKDISFIEFGMALATIAILYLTPKKLKNIVPPQLIALIMISFVSALFFQTIDIKRIGEINVSLP